MSFKDELLFDFAISMPRILISGGTVIIDNIKKVVMLTENQLIIFNGKRYSCLTGKNFIIKELGDGRMLVNGEFDEIRFYKELQENKDRGISSP